MRVCVQIAAALGYVAHMVDRLSVYMDVPLRYPVLPAMSRSHIWDPCPALTPTNAASGMHRHAVPLPYALWGLKLSERLSGVQHDVALHVHGVSLLHGLMCANVAT